MNSKSAVIGSFCLFLFALDCSAQTVADAARKERERQKRLHSTMIIVNGATTTIAASSSTATTAAKAAAATASTGPVDNKGRDEKYWRKQFDDARAALKKAEDNAQLLDLKIKDLNTQLLRQSDMYNREYRLGPEIAETQKQLDDAHKQADDAKKRISDLEDDLRRSGGPAGWAR